MIVTYSYDGLRRVQRSATLDGVTVDNLRPFVKGDERARAAAQRSAEVRRAKRDVQRATNEDVAAQLRRLATSHERADLGPIAAAAALDAIGRVQRGEWKVRDPADWVRVLVDIARLEAGEPTSASAVLHLGASAVERVRALQREAAQLGPSSSALAADDPPVCDGPAPEVVGGGAPPPGGGGE